VDDRSVRRRGAAIAIAKTRRQDAGAGGADQNETAPLLRTRGIAGQLGSIDDEPTAWHGHRASQQIRPIGRQPRIPSW